MYKILIALDDDGRKWEVYGTTTQSGRTYNFTVYGTDDESDLATTMLTLAAEYGTSRLMVVNELDYDVTLTIADSSSDSSDSDDDSSEDTDSTASSCNCDDTETATDEEIDEVLDEVFGDDDDDTTTE